MTFTAILRKFRLIFGQIERLQPLITYFHQLSPTFCSMNRIDQVKGFLLSDLSTLRIAALEYYDVITKKIRENRQFEAVN